MKTVAASGTHTFPLKDQYVPAVKAARASMEVKADDGNEQDPEAVASGSRKRNPDWNYADVRKAFIAKAKIDHGIAFSKAQEMWNTSDEKRNYLKHVSVRELKRRKFIGKDVMENPWS